MIGKRVEGRSCVIWRRPARFRNPVARQIDAILDRQLEIERRKITSADIGKKFLQGAVEQLLDVAQARGRGSDLASDHVEVNHEPAVPSDVGCRPRGSRAPSAPNPTSQSWRES